MERFNRQWAWGKLDHPEESHKKVIQFRCYKKCHETKVGDKGLIHNILKFHLKHICGRHIIGVQSRVHGLLTSPVKRDT